MTAYKRGDIVLVPFLFSDQTTTKKRPAVVVTSNNYNEASLDIVIMAITSQAEKTLGIGECLIKNNMFTSWLMLINSRCPYGVRIIIVGLQERGI